MAFIDRTGQKTGSLTVITDNFGDQLHCVCDCGREGYYPRGIFKPSYRGKKACVYCLGSPCEVCGEIIPSNGRMRAKTCAGECREIRHRQLSREHYYKNKDTAHWKAVRARYVQALKHKLDKEPELYEQFRQNARETLARSRHKVNSDPVKREEYLKKRRERHKLFLIELKKNPERYQKYLERCRNWYHSLSDGQYFRIYLAPRYIKRKK